MKLKILAALTLIPFLYPSCASNEQFQQRMDQRNDAYSNYSERREIRTDARQERTDKWFERHMN